MGDATVSGLGSSFDPMLLVNTCREANALSTNELANRTLAARRAEHDALVDLVQGMNEEALSRPSGAAEWTVTQVLHTWAAVRR